VPKLAEQRRSRDGVVAARDLTQALTQLPHEVCRAIRRARGELQGDPL
jgi:hypothetical protein